MTALLTRPVDDATRRQVLGGAGVLLLTAACGTEGEPAIPAGTGARSPAVLEHKYGTTEIPAAPERVVSVGFTDQDYLMALGVTPVGVREWFGAKPFATWPWAQDELADAEPAVLPREELNFERIAALAPDLITGLYSGMTERDYELLAQIAPTLAQPRGAAEFAVPWQLQTRMIGCALSRSDRAEQLVADIERRIDRARAAHPQFRGASAVIASAPGGEYYVYGPATASSEFLLSLGFRVPAEIARLTDNANSYFAFSGERLDLVDLDLLVWLEAADDPGPASLRDNPLYQRLDVATQGRDLFLGYDVLAGALSFSSVLSLPFLLDELVPMIAAAVDGDPTTEVPS